MNDRPNIWQLQAQGNYQHLISALRHESPDIRRRAAAALRVLGTEEAVPPLRRALKDEQDAETQTHLQLALDGLLADLKAAEVEQAGETRQLIAQLKSSDPAIVGKAATALGKLNDKLAVEPLVLTFQNRQLPANTRLAAAEALIELDSAPIVVTLIAALKSDAWHIRRNAAAVLGHLQADWAVARLADRLRDEHEMVRRTAQAALERIGTPQAQQALTIYAREQARPKSDTTRTAPPVILAGIPLPEAITPDKARTQESPVLTDRHRPANPSESETPPTI